MNRLLVLAAILFALGLGAIAKAQVGLPFPGPGTIHSAGGGGFQGVGDVVSGSLGHWGTIAYSAARRGNRMLNLCNSAVCADVNSDATTGIVPNAPTINGAPCDNSGHQCSVKIAYDDTGGTFCTGNVACDLDTALGTQPTFVVSASGSVPGISCNGSQGLRTTLAGFAATHNQPISSAASYSIVGTGATESVSGLGTQVLQAIRVGGFPEGYAGSALFAGVAISTGTFVATTVTQDGSGNGSLATNNGTPTTGAIGTNNVGASDQTYFCGDGFGDPLTGTILEVLWHPAQFTGGNVTNITANMRTNGGF